MDELGNDVAKKIKAQNAYKTSAILTLMFMVIVAFFISLGSAKFDFNKIWQAQFWIDFGFTFFGGQFIKFAFGRWGDYEGHKNVDVVQAIKDVNDDNIKIKEKELITKLKEWISKNNDKRKLRALRRKTYKKLNASPLAFWINKKKWRKVKECLITSELILKEKDQIKVEKLKDELVEKNFDLESQNVKFHRLREEELQTGFTTSNKEEDQMSYSEMYQLFGKNATLTIALFALTILMAITAPFLYDLSWTIVYVFVSRLATFFSNAYFGFSIGKSGVEKVKLSVLRTIHRFLSMFLENNKEVI